MKMVKICGNLVRKPDFSGAYWSIRMYNRSFSTGGFSAFDESRLDELKPSTTFDSFFNHQIPNKI
jgi:hypothetical protein